MPGATLSRWTLSYFAAAMLFLIAAEVLMTLGFGYPAAALQAPETLIVVHFITIGWLSLLMCGALFQFVPVLVARPLYSNSLPLPTLACLITGLGALLLGFLQIAGTVMPHFAFLPAAAILLALGFALALWNLGRTLWAARPLPLPARFVAVGLFSAGATVTFGVIFALVLGGATTYPHLVDVTANGVPLHAIAGLGGWLTFTAMGVSYRLLAMFMLAPELHGPATRGALYAGAAALAIAIGGGAAAICIGTSIQTMLAVATLLGLTALALYGRDILHVYRTRKRRLIELNSRMAAFALVNLAAVVVLTLFLIVFDKLDAHIGTVVFFVSFGWLSGLALAKLYKIVAFLTWLECYGPVLGKMATPRVQDLAVEPRALRWYLLYFTAVWASTGSLLVGLPLVFRIAAAIMLVSTVGIVAELVRIRRLADVKPTLRLPASVSRPRLFSSFSQHA
jgi:hypothetical protein